MNVLICYEFSIIYEKSVAEYKKYPIALKETALTRAVNEVYSPTVIKTKQQTSASFSWGIQLSFFHMFSETAWKNDFAWPENKK